MGKAREQLWFGLAGGAIGAVVGYLLNLFVSPAIGGQCDIICVPYRAVIASALLGAFGGVAVASAIERRRLGASTPRVPESPLQRRRRVALRVGAAVVLLMTLLPPWTITRLADGGQTTITTAGRYRLLWKPPHVEKGREGVQVDLGRLLAQYIAVAALTAVAVLTVRGRPAPSSAGAGESQKET